TGFRGGPPLTKQKRALRHVEELEPLAAKLWGAVHPPLVNGAPAAADGFDQPRSCRWCDARVSREVASKDAGSCDRCRLIEDGAAQPEPKTEWERVVDSVI